MSERTFTERLGRGFYAASGGDLAAYDKVKQDAEAARQKAILDAQERQLKQQQWQYEQQAKLQEAGYQPMKQYADSFTGGAVPETLNLPGVGTYARSFAGDLKRQKDEAALEYSRSGARMNNIMADMYSGSTGTGLPQAPVPGASLPSAPRVPSAMVGGRFVMPPMPSAMSGDPTTIAPSGDYMLKPQLTHMRGMPMMSNVPVKTPLAEGRDAGIVEGGKVLGKEQADASVSIARDNAQLGQMSQSLKNLYSLHTDLTKSGLAGDAFASLKGKNIDKIPAAIQSLVASPADQEKLGQFVSARNETMTKMQPMLSQQFGQAGSVRIMDSLLQLSGKELPDLSTPNAMAKGQVKGTLRTMFVIGKAGEKYAEALAKQGKSLADVSEEDAIKGIRKYQVQTSLTDAQEKELKQMTDEVLGTNIPKDHTAAQTASGVTFSFKKLDK